MSSYSDLLAKAQNQEADRFTFEQKATTKAIELHNALTEALDAPPNMLDAVKLKADDGETALGDEYILTPTGLKFGIVVRLGQAHIRNVFLLAPKGQRYILKMEGHTDIDVTDKAGVTEWTDWMERVLEDRLSKNISGRLSALMALKYS